jgi:hypothetical protein
VRAVQSTRVRRATARGSHNTSARKAGRFRPELCAPCVYVKTDIYSGQILAMPHSRPMPSIGVRCHELRIQDQSKTWRIIYRVDADAIVIAEVFAKTTQATPKHVLATSQRRLRLYDKISEGES